METERVLPLEQRPQEFLPTSLNCIQFQHLHLICRPHSAVCRRRKMDIAAAMPRLPDVKIAQPDLLIRSTGLSLRNGMKGKARRIIRAKRVNVRQHRARPRVHFVTPARSATLRRRPYGKGRHSESRRRHLVAVHQTLRTGKQPHSLAARANQLVCFKSEIAWLGLRQQGERKPTPDDLSILKQPAFQKALDEFEDLMTQSSRAFLIGAGCSKCAGLPLTAELTTKSLASPILDSTTKEILTAVQR